MSRTRRTLGSAALLATGAMLLGGCSFFWPSIDPHRARIDARTKLGEAADDPDPTTRAQAMEAMAEVIGESAGGVFLEALDDRNPMVRFAAAMAIGDCNYAPAKDKLLKMADKGEANKLTFIGVAYALARLNCLSESAGTEMGRLLIDPEKDVRATTALVMGKTGNASAVSFLRAVLADEREPMVRLQITESLAILGDQRSASALEAFTKSQFMDERLVAIPALAKARYDRAPVILRGFLGDPHPPPVRVAAAGALAVLGETDFFAYRYCVSCAKEPDRILARAYGGDRQVTQTDVVSLRVLAAISLGRMGRTDAVDTLHPLLFYKEGQVRVAAAMSILRLLGPGEPEDRPRPKATTRAGTEEPGPPKPKLRTAGGKD